MVHLTWKRWYQRAHPYYGMLRTLGGRVYYRASLPTHSLADHDISMPHASSFGGSP